MKSIRTALIVAAASVALLGVAAPASAAPPALPPEDQLISVSCTVTMYASLISVDSQTGAATLVGTDADYACAYQGAWDYATDTYYGVDGDGPGSRLVTIDVATGATEVVGSVVDSVSDSPVFIDALVITTEGAGYFVSSGVLYSINLSTAVATNLGPLTSLTVRAWGFSVDPRTGALYLLQENGDLFEVDPTAVTATYLASWTLSPDGDYAYGPAIDHAGTAWVVEWELDGDFYGPVLWSTSLADFGVVQELSGEIINSDSEGQPIFENWWVSLVPAPPVPVVPVPALADTGVSVVPWAAGALVLGALGGALVMRARRRDA